ncbi:phospholipase-like protein [Tanacetum coccineum]
MVSNDIVEKDSHPSRTLPCQLQPKELTPGSFSLPCTIGSFNLYSMTDLGTCVNIMPYLVFEYLKLTDLKKTDILVRMANMTQQAPLGTVENVLIKIDKFVFPCDFVVIDMPGILGEMMILDKPFLATIHAQIDVFNGEISFGIGEDRVKFDVNGNSHHSNATLEKVYMETKKESFNPLEIEDGLFSYESPACLQFSQNTRIHTNSDIETIDSPSNIQETSESCADHQLDNKKDTSRWHVCKPIRVFYDNGSVEDCRMWPTCNPDLSFCSGYEAVYGKCEHEMVKQWVYFQDHERRDVKGSCMKFADFLHVRYTNKKIDDTTREQRYYEWIAQHYEFDNDRISSITAALHLDNIRCLTPPLL